MQLFRPDNTVVVFDIHGVLLKTDYRKILALLRTRQTFILLKYLCNPRVLWAMIKLSSRNAIAEEYLVYCTSRYKQLADCKDLLLAIANAQKPIDQTCALVYSLKQQGYSLHILSNIGLLMYHHLYQRFPHLFDQFDKIKIANPTENYLSKPNPRMYELYLKECNPEGKQVIFIDDKQKNIRAAQNAGMLGLRFKTGHDLHQKMQQLIQF